MALPTLKAQRAADIAVLYDPSLPWVEEAAVSGLPAFYARINYDPGFLKQGEIQAGRATAMVQKADWPAPAVHDRVTIAGITWTVAEIPEHANLTEWRLALLRDTRIRF